MPASYAHAPVQFLPDEATGCWIWQRSMDQNGYGQMRVCHKLYRAHAFFYEYLVGPVPDGLELDHLCRNPACVNPAHLEPVTRAVNTQRGNAAKLTLADVEAIRGSTDGLRALGRRYGVSHSTIRKVKLGESWRDFGLREAAA